MKRNGVRAVHTLGKHYIQLKDALNTLDRHMNTAKKVYNDLQPNIQSVAGEDVVNHINKGISSYDKIRNKVVDTHGQAEQHANAIVGSMRRNGVNIGI